MNRENRVTVSPAPATMQQPQQQPRIFQQPAMRMVPHQQQMMPISDQYQHQQHPYNNPQMFHPPPQHQMQPRPLAPATATMQQRPECGTGAACMPSPMPMTPQQQQEKTMTWGLQNYVMAHDSGFQSRATRSVVSTATTYSNLSSITGLESECGSFYGGYPSGAAGPSGSVYPQYMQPNASAPCDMAGGNFEYPGGQQQGFQHPFMQGQGVYPESQREMEQVMTATHHLAKLVRDEGDLEGAKRAAFMVHNLAKSPENARLIVKSAELIDAVVAALHSGMQRKDNEILKSTTGIFYLLSNTDEIQAEGLEAIYRSGAVPLFIRLLSGECEFEAVLNYSMTVVHNLLSFHPKATEVIRAADAVPPLVRLLARDHDKFLAIVTDSLRMLCDGHTDAQMKVCDGGGLHYFVRILEHSNYEKVLWMTARVVQMLSNFQPNKQPMLNVGCIQALSRHLAHPSHRLVVHCLEALRNLSDLAVSVENVESLLCSLVQNLGSSDERVVGYCVSILYNLTCKNAANKEFVCEQMGIESLARTLNERWYCPYIVEDILGVLRHLTWQWAGVHDARNKLRSIGCLPLIGRYLRLCELPGQFADYPGVMVEALALIRNLTMDGGASWPDFRYHNIVNSTAELTIQIRDMIFHVIDHAPPRLQKCLEIIEWALLALAGLCKDEENRQLILAKPTIAELANEFMMHPLSAESLRRAATKCLVELGLFKVVPNAEEQSCEMKQESCQNAGPSFRAAASMDYGLDPYQQHDQREQSHHQPVQQQIPMPSPMQWPQQMIGQMDYENPASLFDYEVMDDLSDANFGLYEGDTTAATNTPGPSRTADEEMKNLHL